MVWGFLLVLISVDFGNVFYYIVQFEYFLTLSQVVVTAILQVMSLIINVILCTNLDSGPQSELMMRKTPNATLT